MLKFLVLLACAHCACRADLADLPDLADLAEERDPMLWALQSGGAVRAAVCVEAGAGAGCAGALWARHWVLARASCVSAGAGSGRRAPVVLYLDPGDCKAYLDAKDRRGYVSREVLARFVHPAYFPPADDEDEMELLYAAFPSSPAAKAAAAAKANKTAPVEWDPLDAVLLLLATPARVPPYYNYSATYETLMPQLVSWLRYVPALVPWALESRPPPQPRFDPARVSLLDSPLRLLLAAVVLPVCALLLCFFLLLRVTEPCEDRLKLLEAAAEPARLTPDLEHRAPALAPLAPEHNEMV